MTPERMQVVADALRDAGLTEAEVDRALGAIDAPPLLMLGSVEIDPALAARLSQGPSGVIEIAPAVQVVAGPSYSGLLREVASMRAALIHGRTELRTARASDDGRRWLFHTIDPALTHINTTLGEPDEDDQP